MDSCPECHYAPLNLSEGELCPRCILSSAVDSKKSAPTPPEIPTLEVLEAIGEGGFGYIFRARDHDGGDVAVKLLKNHDNNDELIRRFELEKEILRQLKHPRHRLLHQARRH